MADPSIPTKAEIDAAFSPALYGMMIGLSLYGIALAQVAYYYRKFPMDANYWKILTGSLLVLDSLHIFSLAAGIHDWFLIERLSFRYPTGALIASFTTYIIETIVQSAYALRVWTLSEHNRWLTSAVILSSVIQLAGGMGVGHELAVGTSINSAHSVRTKIFGAIQLVASVICDVLISISLVFYLNRNRNGLRRTENIIDRLIIYSINVGLVTSAVAILNLVFWWAQPENFNFVIFHYIVSKLYINSLLVTLNSRAAFRRNFADNAISMDNLGGSPDKRRGV